LPVIRTPAGEEAVMPMMIRELSPMFADASAAKSYRFGKLVINDPDFVMVLGFSVIGLILGLTFAFLISLPEELTVLL
jgi:hypothetical protein